MNLVEIYNNQIISRKEITSIESLENGAVIELLRGDMSKIKKHAYKVCEKAGNNLYSVKSLKEAAEKAKFAEANKKIRKPKISISFEEYCEDYLDMHIALMSDEEKAEAYKSYKN